MQTVRLNEVDLTRRAVERGGWLGALPSDPGAEPEWPAPRPAPVRVAAPMPALRSDFDPAGLGPL